MIITTMGSELWPKSPEGRILCLILATYAFAIFGYVTATVATFFIGKEREERKEMNKADIEHLVRLEQEIKTLRELIEQRIPR